VSGQTQVRTYGGWRRSRGMGLFGLGPAQTFAVLAAVTTLIIAGSMGLTALAVAAVPCVLLVAGLLMRWDGVTLSAAIAQRVRWLVGSTRGYTSYRSGVMVAGEHAWQLPGVLAPTTLLTVADDTGDYGLVYNCRLGTMTVTLRCAATSTWLADADAAAAWVANWGGWLANLGYLPIVDHVAVTVDTAPDPGSRLTDHVSRRIVPNGPAAARRVLQRLVEVSPAAAADVETRVSVTFKPSAAPSKPRDLDEALEEINRALPGLQDSLGSCGLTVLARATATNLAAMVHTAFDPASRGDVARLSGTGGMDLGRWLDWDTAGPVMAEEHLDRYAHDSGTSVSWAWHEAPRQHVHADVLARLLAPGPYPKRVSLLYRPFPAGQAARIVESEVNAAAFRSAYNRAQRRDESARDHADRERAMQTAREEATGAGVGLMSLFVTTTVLNPDDLGRAVADVESRADVAKIRLRRLRASQAAGFATTLPCGVCPPQLARYWPH
jgi:hypothetical protein